MSSGFLPNTRLEDEQSLHALYKACVSPLQILQKTSSIIEKESASLTNLRTFINKEDHKGDTPLDLLILHTNRGLRYHPYKIFEIQKLEDSYAQQKQLDEVCQTLDYEYQSQVLKCISLLLSSGSDPNHVPGTTPGIVSDSEWAEGFEMKIMQSEQRWNLLGPTASMKYSKYNTFDPLTNCKVLNSNKLTTLHIAAWRGDASAIEQLIHAGADGKILAADGRSTMHFLYHYCNKPSDLPRATALLIEAGADVNAVDSRGNTALMLLLYHIFIKRSHVQYMATQLLEEYVQTEAESDHFHQEILETMRLLILAGANVNHSNKDCETPLHLLYKRFKRALENCHDEFQIIGHHIVPYKFSIKPLILFGNFLLESGALIQAVDVYGNTALHKLCQCLRGLALSNDLNSTEDLIQCFALLIKAGVNINAQGSLMKTAVHMMLETIVQRFDGGFHRYQQVLELLVENGADVNKPDQLGNTAIALVFGKTIAPKYTYPLLLCLLRCGGNPNIANRDGKLPLQLLLRMHVLHHDPGHLGHVTTDLTYFLKVMHALCQTMSFASLSSVASVYQAAGFYGVVCSAACPVYQCMLGATSQPRSLTHTTRLQIWRHMGTAFFSNHTRLPLPGQIKNFLYELIDKGD